MKHPESQRRIRNPSAYGVSGSSTSKSRTPRNNFDPSIPRSSRTTYSNGNHIERRSLRSSGRDGDHYDQLHVSSRTKQPEMPTPNILFRQDDDNIFAQEYESYGENQYRNSRDSWQGTFTDLDASFANDNGGGSIRCGSSGLGFGVNSKYPMDTYGSSPEYRVSQHIAIFHRSMAEVDHDSFAMEGHEEREEYGRESERYRLEGEETLDLFYASFDPFNQGKMIGDKDPTKGGFGLRSNSKSSYIEDEFQVFGSSFEEEAVRNRRPSNFPEDIPERFPEPMPQYGRRWTEHDATLRFQRSTGATQRAQKRKLSPPKEDAAHRSIRNKITQHADQSENQSISWVREERIDDGSLGVFGAYDDGGDGSFFSVRNSPRRPESPTSVHFYNEGEKFDLAGDPLNAKPSALIAIPQDEHEHDLPPTDPCYVVGPPDLFF